MLPRINVISTDIGTYLLPASLDLISRRLYFSGSWEAGTLSIAKALMPPRASHVVDVGANLGAFTIPIGKLLLGSNGKVTSFEAQRIVFYQLCGNIYLNRLDNVHACHVAIGDRTGEIDVPILDYALEQNIGGLSLDPSVRQQPNRIGTTQQASAAEQVPLNTLDSLGLDPADLIKIDVEGMELEVLRGATSYLAASKFPPILFELWSPRHTWFAAKRQATIDWITGQGYHLQILNELCVAQHKSHANMVRVDLKEN